MATRRPADTGSLSALIDDPDKSTLIRTIRKVNERLTAVEKGEVDTRNTLTQNVSRISVIENDFVSITNNDLLSLQDVQSTGWSNGDVPTYNGSLFVPIDNFIRATDSPVCTGQWVWTNTGEAITLRGTGGHLECEEDTYIDLLDEAYVSFGDTVTVINFPLPDTQVTTQYLMYNQNGTLKITHDQGTETDERFEFGTSAGPINLFTYGNITALNGYKMISSDGLDISEADYNKALTVDSNGNIWQETQDETLAMKGSAPSWTGDWALRVSASGIEAKHVDSAGIIRASNNITSNATVSGLSLLGASAQVGSLKINTGSFRGSEKLRVVSDTGAWGIENTDGTVNMGTFINANGGWFGTETNHPLLFFVNNGNDAWRIDTSENFISNSSNNITTGGTISGSILQATHVSGQQISEDGTPLIVKYALSGTGGGGSSTLTGLTDTSVGSAVSGSLLSYDGTNWTQASNASVFESGLKVNWRIESDVNSIAVGALAGENADSADNITAIGWQALRNNTGANNTAVGQVAGGNNTGDNNVFIGNNAGERNSGGENVLIGASAGIDMQTGSNIAIGRFAAQYVTAGDGTFIGRAAGQLSVSGSQLTAVAQGALQRNNNGSQNTGLGYFAGARQRDGDGNTGLGWFAGYGQHDDYTGNRGTYVGYAAGRYASGLLVDDNVFVGWSAGRGDTTGFTGRRNTYVGVSAGTELETANDNTFVGYQAGFDVSTGSSNVAIGKQAMWDSTTSTQTVAIGFEALRKATTGANRSVAIGYSAAEQTSTCNDSIVIGYFACFQGAVNLDNSVVIGRSACQSTTGNIHDSVVIGYTAAQNETALEDKLWIENSTSSSPLIWGDFATDDLSFQADLHISGGLTISGTTDQSVGVNTESPNFTLEVQGSDVCLPVQDSAPTDGNIPNGSFVPYLDEGANEIKFRVKYSDGTLKTWTGSLT